MRENIIHFMILESVKTSLIDLFIRTIERDLNTKTTDNVQVKLKLSFLKMMNYLQLLRAKAHLAF